MRLLSTSCRSPDVETRMNALTSSGVMQLLWLLAVILSCQGCPDKCTCSSQTVKCQNLDLDAIPHFVPADSKLLWITGNNISSINEDSFPSHLELLTDLDLSDNEMGAVEETVFHNLPNLERLDLSNNKIQSFSEKAFPHDNKLQVLNLSRSFHNLSSVNGLLNVLENGNLVQLTVLDLSHNDLVLLQDDLFRSLSNLVNLSLQNSSIISIPDGILKVPRLQDLDLRHNGLRNLPSTTLTEFNLKSDLHIRLEGNPWRCDCFIEDMLVWLQNSTQVTDMNDLTCADPEGLRRWPLVQVQQSRLKCSGNMEGVLETSYVFLGLVLALIGIIFLLVLYLNRKGIKRWMYNIRDACRDHMEGYHYRDLCKNNRGTAFVKGFSPA
ncbi:trophoblast glycoprotein b isoform X2 [Phyllopteryx taeniolatus]|uniref:trophoblast glycoprotein b isoform X2 n=1 Tax=Phyllopteryx taeniolatus TaxID=161469 RepID=UPI002AD233A0|nr:trophoblast glycoprotein b isoform X2 [Phyllopteryx taeniolatus]